MEIDNLIFINGGSYTDIKKALRQWMRAYSDDLPNDLTFELYKNEPRKHIIRADERLDNWVFYFLINYLNYPEGIEYKVEIEGFTSGNNDDILKNEKLLVYIPIDDEDFDNVYVTTSNDKNYKVSFGGKITEVDEDKPYRLPANQHLENPEIIKINKDEISRKKIEKSKKNTEKRFNIISIIIFVAFIFNLLIPSIPNGIQLYEKTTLILFISVAVWFWGDYKMLESDTIYLKCLLIAFGVLFYNYLSSNYIPQYPFKLMKVNPSIFPLTILMVQWPARRIFKSIFKRDPKVDKHGKIADVIYTCILVVGWFTLSFWLMATFK